LVVIIIIIILKEFKYILLVEWKGINKE